MNKTSSKAKKVFLPAAALALAVCFLVPAAQAVVDASGHFSRAQFAWEQGDYDTAMAEYQAVINLLGDDAAARHNRALIFLETDRIADGRAEAARAVELAPEEGRYRITLAVALMTGKNPEDGKAREELLTGVRFLNADEDAPGLVRAYYNLGLIAQRRRALPEARRWYRHALQLDPNDEPTLTAMESLEGQKD